MSFEIIGAGHTTVTLLWTGLGPMPDVNARTVAGAKFVLVNEKTGLKLGAPSRSPAVYGTELEEEYPVSTGPNPTPDDLLYDLSRKSARTPEENETLAKLRADYKQRTGYDYV